MLYLTACLTWLSVPIAGITVSLTGLAVAERSPEMLSPAGQAMGALLALLFLRWLISLRARCPLCTIPVMGGKKCVRHKRAQTLLGSHTVLVAYRILMQGQFTCPYCNERTMMLHRNETKEASGRKMRRRSSRDVPENEVWRDL
ncbi:MAG: hypothetical protein ACO3JG_09325 [Luteolibacter sp.]